MEKIDELLEMWKADAQIDRIEPGKALLDIPKLHSKYLNILSANRLLAKEAEFKYNKMRKLKWEYYTGKLDKDTLDKYGWQQFQFVLKSDISIYMDADEDLMRLAVKKKTYDEIVELCQAILKELGARTFQLRDYISWERFIQGSH